MKHLIHHPRRCRTTGNQHKIITHVCPSVLKEFESRNEVRFWGVYPWHLVDKDSQLAETESTDIEGSSDIRNNKSTFCCRILTPEFKQTFLANLDGIVRKRTKIGTMYLVKPL